jgi:hypothetical protein
MASYLKKYVTALASAKDYVAQWSSDHVYADEALIVPFPTLAIFDPDKQVWAIHIKAWLYLPFEGKKLKSYLPSLPRFINRKNEEKTDESINEDTEKKVTAAIANEDKNKESTDEECADDVDMYEDALRELNQFGLVFIFELFYLEDEMVEQSENPGRVCFFFFCSYV